MGCVPAKACKQALHEATQKWPNRSRASDGICASATHSSQNSSSDHEVGNAFDLTHDPQRGCDAHYMVRELADRRDPRVKYLISQGQIWNPSISYQWRAYKGSNPHKKHAHVSIKPHVRDDTRPWWGQEDDELTPDEKQMLKEVHDFVTAVRPGGTSVANLGFFYNLWLQFRPGTDAEPNGHHPNIGDFWNEIKKISDKLGA